MQTQLELLTDTPRARMADPETSHVAAAEIKQTGVLGEQQREVLEWVNAYPGLTTAELAQKKAEATANGTTWQTYRPMFGRRMKELQPIHVQEGESRQCKVTGRAGSKRKCLTYYPTDRGSSLARGGQSN